MQNELNLKEVLSLKGFQVVFICMQLYPAANVLPDYYCPCGFFFVVVFLPEIMTFFSFISVEVHTS